MGLLAVLLGAFGSVFNTYSSLYLSKDNDLLLSMPIPVRSIMASRLLGVYLMGLMYSGRGHPPRRHRLLAHRAPDSGRNRRLPALCAAPLRHRPDPLLCAGLGGGEDQPEAEEQELHGSTDRRWSPCGAYYFFYFKAQSMVDRTCVCQRPGLRR